MAEIITFIVIVGVIDFIFHNIPHKNIAAFTGAMSALARAFVTVNKNETLSNKKIIKK